ncbi:MAG TPA: TnsA endonuclease N-terminal domain-containing protein [Victivallales bacterium]|nr:TnsA endonuclease N-terminal domain-containing protein [Victivallales bacterium]
MAKRKYTFDENKYTKFLSEKRGLGTGFSYKPWLTIHDVPSLGVVVRIKGWKTNRIHHLLSKYERDYFYLLEWADDIVDINEQFPLDRSITLQIADQLNIKHPTDTYSKVPIVMTSDFKIKCCNSAGEFYYKIRTVKPSGQLADERVNEKFHIEKVYWKLKGVDWGVVTEKQIPKIVAKNIKQIHNLKNVDQTIEMKKENCIQIIDLFSHYLGIHSNFSINHISNIISNKIDIKSEFVMTIIWHLIANKIIILPLNMPWFKIIPNSLITVKSINEYLKIYAAA